MTGSGCFLVVEGPGEEDERRVPLGESSIVLGRDESVDVPVADPKLSRRHAAFRMIDGHPYVEDLGSINGVKVRGRRIEERRRLRDGERVRLGGTLVRVLADDLPPPTTSLGPRILGPDVELELVGEIRVGRARDCGLRLDDVSVSRLHALIEANPPTVRDLDSAHGVFLNDIRIRWARLKDGDELRFGQLSFEVEIPMDSSGPRTMKVWRSPWPRRLAAVGLATLLTLGLGFRLGLEQEAPSSPESPPTVLSSAEPARQASVSEAQVPEVPATEAPAAGAREGSGPTAEADPDAGVDGPGPGTGPARAPQGAPTAPSSKTVFAAPASWQESLQAYFDGDLERAHRRARAPELRAWLSEAEARHARALTEVSNDVERAKVLLGALARTESRVWDEPSPMRRDLRLLLAVAYAERAETQLEQARGAKAFQRLLEAQALAPEHPRVRALARNIDVAARAKANQAEAWSRGGDQRSCRAWEEVAAMTLSSSSLGRRARRTLDRSCEAFIDR